MVKQQFGKDVLSWHSVKGRLWDMVIFAFDAGLQAKLHTIWLVFRRNRHIITSRAESFDAPSFYLMEEPVTHRTSDTHPAMRRLLSKNGTVPASIRRGGISTPIRRLWMEETSHGDALNHHLSPHGWNLKRGTWKPVSPTAGLLTSFWTHLRVWR